jgi:hypothetical protein
MRDRCIALSAALIAFSLVVAGGCPGVGTLLPGLNIIQVELINDTGFPVDPNIRFDDDAGFLASLAPSENLSTGLIQPDDPVLVFNFDCDELGLIFSDGAEQVHLFEDYVADESRILERDDEYECGDVIRFRFVGDGLDFGVIVSVNGRIVD